MSEEQAKYEGQPKHTPGPWFVDPFGPPYNIYVTGSGKLFDVRGWGYFTGQGTGALGLSDEEALGMQEANAHLVAAAPRMRETLLTTARNLQSLINAKHSDHVLMSKWLAEVEATLADATGETK